MTLASGGALGTAGWVPPGFPLEEGVPPPPAGKPAGEVTPPRCAEQLHDAAPAPPGGGPAEGTTPPEQARTFQIETQALFTASEHVSSGLDTQDILSALIGWLGTKITLSLSLYADSLVQHSSASSKDLEANLQVSCAHSNAAKEQQCPIKDKISKLGRACEQAQPVTCRRR